MIRMFDPQALDSHIQDEIKEAVSKVLDSGHYILGDYVEAFEEQMAKYLGVKYAIGVASGTDALYMALKAVGATSPVMTSTFTFIASAECVCRAASPNRLQLADINLDTYCMDVPDHYGVFIPVHLFGHPCDMSKFTETLVIEDCAQALGAEHEGRKVGTIGVCGCLSFYPTKMLGGCGDGGMVVTNDKSIAHQVRVMRNHGTPIGNKYVTVSHGLNSRLDAIQAVILSVKLRYIDDFIAARRARATCYNDLLAECEQIVTPFEAANCKHVFNYYTIRVKAAERRNDLRRFLASKGIETIVYFPYPIHRQPVFDGQFDSRRFHNADLAASSVLSLPLYPELKEPEVEFVAESILEYFA